MRTVAAGKADALIFVPSRLLNLNVRRIANFALEQRLPSVSMWGAFTENGGLMNYGPDISSMIKRSAHHVDKILKGAKPADLRDGAPDTLRVHREPQDGQSAGADGAPVPSGCARTG